MYLSWFMAFHGAYPVLYVCLPFWLCKPWTRRIFNKVAKCNRFRCPHFRFHSWNMLEQYEIKLKSSLLSHVLSSCMSHVPQKDWSNHQSPVKASGKNTWLILHVVLPRIPERSRKYMRLFHWGSPKNTLLRVITTVTSMQFIAAKFVHLFVFGTVSLVKQLQAWFISAPPDKEPKHLSMMPNHVSTLPGSSSATKVITFRSIS